MSSSEPARRRPLRLAIAGLMLGALTLQGCAGGGIGSMFNGLESYNDPSDTCNYARQPLIESGRAFSEDILAGAAIGAVGGALAGAAIDRNRGQGAGFGAIAGGLAGAVGGYLAAKQRQAQNQAELIASIDRDAYRDNTTLVRASNSIGTLTRCRRTQVAGIERSYRGHTITAADAKAQLQHVHDQMRADNDLITQVLGKVDDRSQTYAGARSQAVSSGGTRRVARGGGGTATLQHTEQQAHQEQTQHQEVDSGLQRRISDLSATVG